MFEVWANAGLQDTQMSLSVDANQYVGGVPVYRIANAAPNALIRWTSVKNGIPTGENNDYGQYTDTSGNWTGAGGAWTADYIGNWIKTAFVGGQSANVSFNVSPAPAPAPAAPAPGGSSTTTTTTTTPRTDDAWRWIKENALYLGLGAAALLVLPSLISNFGGGRKGR